MPRSCSSLTAWWSDRRYYLSRGSFESTVPFLCSVTWWSSAFTPCLCWQTCLIEQWHLVGKKANWQIFLLKELVLLGLICALLFDWQILPSGSGGITGFAGRWALWGFSASFWHTTTTLWMWWLRTLSLHASFGGTILWLTSRWVSSYAKLNLVLMLFTL